MKSSAAASLISLAILAVLISMCASASLPIYVVPGGRDSGAENHRVVRGLLDLGSAKERYGPENFEFNKQYELFGGGGNNYPYGYGYGYDPYYYGDYYGYPGQVGPGVDRTILTQKDQFTVERPTTFNLIGLLH